MKITFLTSGLLVCASVLTAGAGSIAGVVTDPPGAVMPNVEISVRNAAAGTLRKVRSGDDGRYEAAALAPGEYEVTAEAPGFATLVRRGITVAAGERVLVDLRMQVSVAVERVTVTERVAAAGTPMRLPLHARRWEHLVLLTPAASNDGGNGLITFRGINGNYNNFLLDGTDHNQAFFAEAKGRARIPYGISAEALQEFRVVAGNFSAQYGRAAGGVIEAVTKSGTNDPHGSFFYLIRDDALNAENSTAKAQGIPQPQDRLQQFGSTLGGALQRNRLFYFLSYDQQTRTFPAGVVPNSPAFLRSPCTAPGCSEVVGFYRSLQGPQDRQGNQWLGLSRLDWNATPRQQLSATVNVLRWDSPNGIYTAPTHNLHASANGTDAVKNETVITRWNSVVRPNLVSELRFGWGRDLQQQAPNAPGPYVAITNGIDFGMPAFLPRAAYPDERRWQLSHGFSWSRGRHSLRFGYEVQGIRDQIANLFQGGGVYSYSTLNDFALDCRNPSLPLGECLSTPTIGAQGRTGKHYTQFVQAFDMLGRAGTDRFSNRDYGLYLEDSFRPASNLLVTLGLRYELETMPAVEAPNPALPATSRIPTDGNNFGPRIGISWNPFRDPKTVIRAGGGMHYGRTQNGTLSSLLRQTGQRLQRYQFLPGASGSPLFPQVLSAPPVAPAGDPDSFFAAGDFASPLTYQLQFTIERELFPNFVLSGTYVGTRGQRFPLFRDINLSPPAGRGARTASYAVCAVPQAGSAGACPRVEQIVSTPFFPAGPRPNPAFGRLTIAESVVNTWYNGFVLQAQHRFARGFSLQAALTVSKAQDNDQIQQVFFAPNQPLNPFQVRDDYSLSDLDQRKRFTLSAYWEPAFGRIGYRPLRTALNGFRLSTVVTLADGRPYSPAISGNPTPMGVSTGILGVGGSTRVPWLGRNIYTTPGLAGTDLRLSRPIPIREALKLDFIAEAFNLFNRANVTAINTTRYNLSGSTLFPEPAFASAAATGNSLTRERQLQLGLRLTF